MFGCRLFWNLIERSEGNLVTTLQLSEEKDNKGSVILRGVTAEIVGLYVRNLDLRVASEKCPSYVLTIRAGGKRFAPVQAVE